MNTMIGTDVVVQIGLVVNDLDKTGRKFADFFGVHRLSKQPDCQTGATRGRQGNLFGETDKRLLPHEIF